MSQVSGHQNSVGAQTAHCQAILPTHDGVITDYIVSVKRTHLGPDQMVFSNHEYRSNIISKTETRPR